MANDGNGECGSKGDAVTLRIQKFASRVLNCNLVDVGKQYDVMARKDALIERALRFIPGTGFIDDPVTVSTNIQALHSACETVRRETVGGRDDNAGPSRVMGSADNMVSSTLDRVPGTRSYPLMMLRNTRLVCDTCSREVQHIGRVTRVACEDCSRKRATARARPTESRQIPRLPPVPGTQCGELTVQRNTRLVCDDCSREVQRIPWIKNAECLDCYQKRATGHAR